MVTPLADGGDLAALVASRVLHDLSGALGALGNGIELLEMTSPPSAELDLLRDSAQAALGRLRLYRLAFGAAAADAVTKGAEVAALVAQADARVAVQAALPDSVPRDLARRGVLGALCAQSALAWGGQLDLRLADADWTIQARAPRLRLDDRLWQALAQGHIPPGMTPAEVPFALLVQALPAPPRIVAGTQELTLSF